jgi:hypothetical protein
MSGLKTTRRFRREKLSTLEKSVRPSLEDTQQRAFTRSTRLEAGAHGLDTALVLVISLGLGGTCGSGPDPGADGNGFAAIVGTVDTDSGVGKLGADKAILCPTSDS